MYEIELQEIGSMLTRIAEDRKNLGIEDAVRKAEDLEIRQSDPAVFQDFNRLKAINIEMKKTKDLIDPWNALRTQAEEIEMLIQLAEEVKDAGQKNDIAASLESARAELEKLELLRFFRDDQDPLNAYLTINSGAGGTESCDWAMILWRMYVRFCEKRGFKTQVLDYQEGEGAGIKSATVLVEGTWAYGWLKCEAGVHRLVRISPFDSAKRRHTSFAAVYATPDADDDVEVNLNMGDVRVDTYRSSGAGGQHVNKTDSAVRLTHEPTGIVVSCQAERSQIQNREKAIKMLKAKLAERARAERDAEQAARAVEKRKIDFGSQIRSYVLHPYMMVKDHRTDHETSNADGVLDGDLDGFLMAYLRQGETPKTAGSAAEESAV